MFSQAIVATDLGRASEGIVGCAGSLSSLGIKEAVLVHAIDLGREPSPEQDAVFQHQTESLEAAGVRVHVETRRSAMLRTRSQGSPLSTAPGSS